MIRKLVRAVIHNAVVTTADNAWPVSVRIDPLLLRSAEILPLEEVDIVNVETGDRFTTWADAGIDGSGEVRVHAGGAHHVRAGDVISIVAYGLLHDGQTLPHKLRAVTVGEKNVVLSIVERVGIGL